MSMRIRVIVTSQASNEVGKIVSQSLWINYCRNWMVELTMNARTNTRTPERVQGGDWRMLFGGRYKQ